jgi:malonyl-CoA decarboxylase
MSPKGLRQSFGLMVNYLYDLDKIEASHTKFRQGEVARSRAVASLL